MLYGILLACSFDAATKVTNPWGSDSAAIDSNGVVDDSSTTNDSSPITDDSDPIDPEQVDDDGDGWTEAMGDCNDSDPNLHPELSDVCDGQDDDCDGLIDEDGGIDAYEPNDDLPWNLGSLEDTPEMSLTAILADDGDVDRYKFSIVDDYLDFFTVTATLSNIPSGATFRLVIERLDDVGQGVEEMGHSDSSSTATVSFDDDPLGDESGDYALVVYSLGGASCDRSYLLGVSQ